MYFNKTIFSYSLLAFLICAISFSQMSADYQIGFKEGTLAADSDKKWFAAGCCLTLTGVTAAYLVSPEPEGSALIGKTADYALGYKEGYKEEQKKNNTKNAWMGCSTTGIVYCGCCLIYMLLGATAGG